ncbi:MAG: MMPL family transporter [Opitutaceae bacterium]
MIAAIIRLVEASRRHSVSVITAALVLSAAVGYYTARHISIDTDTDKLISPDLPWRRHETEVNRNFPQNDNLLAVVVEGATPDQASDAASALAAGMRARPDLFHEVRQPDGALFFRTQGLLFLSREEVQKFSDDMIAAQPLLGTVAADPSLRGVFGAVDLLAQGVVQGEIAPSTLDPAFNAIAEATEASLDGRVAPLSWQTLLSGRKASIRELRHIILAQPTLDYGAVEPGRRAVDAIRSIALSGGFEPSKGVRVRITGPAALSDDQLSALSEGAGLTSAIAVGLLCFWLILAMRSLRTVAAILITLVVGLICCAGFATSALGPLNPISLAFAPLFIGIAIDFGIQFSVRYLAERESTEAAPEAILRAAKGVGLPLTVAALATAVGFLSFVPTDYAGVSSLGLIAGVGMLIALFLNLTLLPALLKALDPKGRAEAAGFAFAGGIDRFMSERRKAVIYAAVILAVVSAAAIPRIRFDFNPIHLQNPRSESVATLNDLMTDPDSTPYTIKILVPTVSDAVSLSQRLSKLPEVSQVISLASFVPQDQEAKLAILEDARSLLSPTLYVATPKQGPTADEVIASIRRCAADIDKAGKKGSAAARRLSDALARVLAAGTGVLPTLDANLAAGLSRRLDDMRLVLQASPVTLASIPQDVARDWVGVDGRPCVVVFPKGDARDNEVLRRFAAAVRAVAPDATGTPISIQESANTVTHAFATAGIVAVGSITLLLWVALRRTRAIAMVLAPLFLAGLLTLAASTVLGMSLNFANIITLPLLLGIGVAFDIYFVMRWLAGEGSLLKSSTARGVLFSALTTGTAFGSLAFSNSPGMSEMGKLLGLSLFFTLACTLFVLPALLGPRAGGSPGEKEQR